MKFKPINGNIVLDVTKDKEPKKVNGLYLAPEKDDKNIGLVVAVDDTEGEYDEGDWVMYRKHAGESVNIDLVAEEDNLTAN